MRLAEAPVKLAKAQGVRDYPLLQLLTESGNDDEVKLVQRLQMCQLPKYQVRAPPNSWELGTGQSFL